LLLAVVVVGCHVGTPEGELEMARPVRDLKRPNCRWVFQKNGERMLFNSRIWRHHRRRKTFAPCHLVGESGHPRSRRRDGKFPFRIALDRHTLGHTNGQVSI